MTGVSSGLAVAKEALERIGALYAIEADINGKPADVRLAKRQTRAVPLLTELKGWLEGERRRLSLKSTLGKGERSRSRGSRRCLRGG